MSVQINVDRKSLKRVQQSIDGLGEVDWFEGVIVSLVKIKSLAQLRLNDKRHVITSRLENSIYVKTNNQTEADKIASREGVENNMRYSWNTVGNKKGGSGDRDLTSVQLSKEEGAVGTNVVYGGKIERLDSYLYWAVKNIQKDIGEYFRKVAGKNKNKYTK